MKDKKVTLLAGDVHNQDDLANLVIYAEGLEALCRRAVANSYGWPAAMSAEMRWHRRGAEYAVVAHFQVNDEGAA